MLQMECQGQLCLLGAYSYRNNRDHAPVSCAHMASRWVPQVCCLPVHGPEELLTVP